MTVLSRHKSLPIAWGVKPTRKCSELVNVDVRFICRSAPIYNLVSALISLLLCQRPSLPSVACVRAPSRFLIFLQRYSLAKANEQLDGDQDSSSRSKLSGQRWPFLYW